MYRSKNCDEDGRVKYAHRESAGAASRLQKTELPVTSEFES